MHKSRAGLERVAQKRLAAHAAGEHRWDTLLPAASRAAPVSCQSLLLNTSCGPDSAKHQTPNPHPAS